MIDSILTALSESALSIRIAEDPILFPWIETFHVLAVTMVFGSLLLVDLRLIGLAGRDYPISSMSKAVVPLTWVAFVVAAITGSLLFMSNPISYWANAYFKAKMLMMVGAGLNMAVFHFWTMRDARLWDTTPTLPGAVRAAGLISLCLWVAIVACGRWIGFTIAPF
jgi:hypothetical protein